MKTKKSLAEAKVLKTLEEMPEEEFQAFFKSLPYRTRLCCQGGLVDWREVLPYWYLKKKKLKEVLLCRGWL